MDNKFHVDPKLWDTLNDDQKQQMMDTLDQKGKAVQSELEKEYQTKVEQVREQTKQELEAEKQAQAERDKQLSAIPEAKRNFAGKLLDKGFTLDEIKSDNPEWFKPALPKADAKVFEEAVIEPHNGATITPSGNTDADLDAKIKLWKKNGMPENATDKDWEDWQTAHDKGLI